MVKQVIKHVVTYVKNVLKKGAQKSDRFVVFEGLGPKAPQGGPKDSPRQPQGSHFIKKNDKMEAQIMIWVMFLWILLLSSLVCLVPRLGGKTYGGFLLHDSSSMIPSP